MRRVRFSGGLKKTNFTSSRLITFGWFKRQSQKKNILYHYPTYQSIGNYPRWMGRTGNRPVTTLRDCRPAPSCTFVVVCARRPNIWKKWNTLADFVKYSTQRHIYLRHELKQANHKRVLTIKFVESAVSLSLHLISMVDVNNHTWWTPCMVRRLCHFPPTRQSWTNSKGTWRTKFHAPCRNLYVLSCRKILWNTVRSRVWHGAVSAAEHPEEAPVLAVDGISHKFIFPYLKT